MPGLPVVGKAHEDARAGAPFTWFIYGSSLDREAFAHWAGEHGYRVPDFSGARAARLDGYRLAFDVQSRFWGGAVASLRGVADGTPTRAGERSHQHLPGNEEVWLVGERRSTGEHKYYLSNLPTETPLKILAATIKARWLCEQAHQQLKEELGLDHFEGRSWSGLHRHALMSMIAFLYVFCSTGDSKPAKRGKKQDRPAASAEPTRDTHRHHRVLQSRRLSTMSLQVRELARAARG